jgi:hypothetical protein
VAKRNGTAAGAGHAAVVGWISADVLKLRITATDAATGATLTDWSAPPNAKFQNNPTIRTCGPYIGAALWGDEGGDAPTMVLLTLGSSTPLFNATSPGSMFAVDVVVDPAASTPTQDVVYYVAAGEGGGRGKRAQAGLPCRRSQQHGYATFVFYTPVAHSQASTRRRTRSATAAMRMRTRLWCPSKC